MRSADEEDDAPARAPLPKEIDLDMDLDEFRRVLRDVLREELGVGEVRLHGGSGGDDAYFVVWGFVEVLPDRVTILAQNAIKPEEIDALWDHLKAQGVFVDVFISNAVRYSKMSCE